MIPTDKLKHPERPILLGVTPSRRQTVTPRQPLMTCDGKPRRRFTESDLLRALSSELGIVTLSRLDTFQGLFCERLAGASCTRVGQGPRSWTKHRGLITQREICLHLLGARFASTHPPRWLAARSFKTAWFSCFDLDAIRTPEERLDENYDFSGFAGTPDELAQIKADIIRDHPRWSRPTPPLESRFHLLNERLRLLGINLDNPRHALILDTPGCGLHVYVFWDKPYGVHQPRLLWESTGLSHVPGHLEFFPSESKALRLPFGHIPGKPDDPDRWQQFVDDYDNGRIRRFNIFECYEELNRHLNQLHALTRSQPKTNLPSRPSSTHPLTFNRLGQPLTRSEQSDMDWYEEFLSRPVRSPQEMERLLEVGIILSGTRWEIFKRLAWHFVHTKKLDEEQAMSEICSWLDDARHVSKDIETARSSGNWSQLERDIRSLLKGQLKNRRRNESLADPSHDRQPRFAPAELAVIFKSLSVVPESDRSAQAHFFLHALQFAKLHGTPLPDNSGYLLAPAINAVIKKWKHCYKNQYQTRLDYAETSGIWSLAREKWQRPGGGGRARTYRLRIPVLPPQQGSLDYDEAHALLISGNIPIPTAEPGSSSLSELTGLDAPDPAPKTQPEATRSSNDSITIPPTATSSSTATTMAASETLSDPWAVYFGQPDKIRLLNEKLAQLLVSDLALGLSREQRRVLSTPGEQLTREEVQAKVGLLRIHRKRFISRITL